MSRRHQPPAATSASGCTGMVVKRLVAGEHAQLPDRRIAPERRDQSRLHVDRGLDVARLAARQRDVQIVVDADVDRRCRGLPHRGGGERGAAFDHELGVVEGEAVIEERGAGILARLHAGRSQHHRDQPHAVAQRGGHQAEARRIGVAGLQAVDGRVLVEQAVAVLLLDAVVLEFAHREVLVVLRKVADQGDGEQRHVARRGVVVRRGQPGAVLEMRAHHAEALGVRVHELREGLLGARDPLGERDGGIVARLHDHAEDQEFHRHRLAQFDEGARPFGAPGVLAHHHGLVELQFAGCELLKHDVGGHQLREAGGFHARHGILRRENLVGAVVDHDVGRGIDRGRRRNRRVDGDGDGRKREQQYEAEHRTKHD